MSILTIVVFCGTQNIALRGHHETLLYGDDNPHDTNSGNFLALLRLLADFGDVVYREHIKSAPNNAQYLVTYYSE